MNSVFFHRDGHFLHDVWGLVGYPPARLHGDANIMEEPRQPDSCAF